MIGSEFDRLVREAFELSDRKMPPDSWMREAWRRIAKDRSDGYVYAALNRLKRSSERQLVKLLDQVQSETDAAMRRLAGAAPERDASCGTCGGHGVVVIRALMRTGKSRHFDQVVLETFERPVFCDLGVACPSCAGGSRPAELYRGYAWDLDGGAWIVEPDDPGEEYERFSSKLLFPEDLAEAPSWEETKALARQIGKPGVLNPPRESLSKRQVLQNLSASVENTNRAPQMYPDLADLPPLA